MEGQTQLLIHDINGIYHIVLNISETWAYDVSMVIKVLSMWTSNMEKFIKSVYNGYGVWAHQTNSIDYFVEFDLKKAKLYVEFQERVHLTKTQFKLVQRSKNSGISF